MHSRQEALDKRPGPSQPPGTSPDHEQESKQQSKQMLLLPEWDREGIFFGGRFCKQSGIDKRIQVPNRKGHRP